ncbi:MAG: hypothetical protein C7B45_06135 [Sulfobacillus acidophilus]|uniref:histidine kinase n=1 Tax=Sulfobacillus acidophilus TaxID=53633 RepID=A0A2T2WK57_9FIRM|nr:MAG: hypothetical protein C7B45_06135 [Sulfobacillus acidophilus]
MGCQGVWVLDPAGEIVVSEVNTTAEMAATLSQRAREAFANGITVVNFASGPHGWIKLLPVRAPHCSGVVAVLEDHQDEVQWRLEVESIAHDINNLLAVTQGHLELLQSSPQGKSASLTEALWMLERAVGLVRRFTEVSLPRSRMPLTMPTEDVVDTLVHVSAFLNTGRFPIEWGVQTKVPPIAVASVDFVEIFHNILQNAADAMPDGGPITIQIRVLEDTVVISVRDFGPGISPNLREDIFKPYFTTKQVGRGLGLYRTRQLVETYHGRIDVVSAPDDGATFVVTLPRASTRESSVALGHSGG